MTGEPAFFELGVGDVERGKAFYGALFGWQFGPGPNVDGATIHTSGIPGGIHAGDPGGGPYLFFRVDDIDESLERVRELGGTLDDSEPDDIDDTSAHGRYILCRDDQGSAFGLYQPPGPL